MPRRMLTREQRNLAARLYHTGWSFRRIGQKFDFAETTIRRSLVRLGIKPRGRRGQWAILKRKRLSVLLRTIRVQSLRDPATGCLNWIRPKGGQDKRGQVWVNGERVRVVNLIYEGAHGPLAPGMEVYNDADRCPLDGVCIELEHLRAGTHGDVLRNAYKRGAIDRGALRSMQIRRGLARAGRRVKPLSPMLIGLR